MRGYPCKLIKHAISKARRMNRKNLFTSKEPRNQDKQIIPFITTYNPFILPVQKIFNTFLKILQENRSTNFIKNTKILAVHRRTKNTRDLLVKSNLNCKKLTQGSYAYKQNCFACKFMKNSTEIKSTTTSEVFKI